MDSNEGLAEVMPAAAGAPSLPAEAVSLVEAYQRASKADATVRTYRADAAAFEAWCSPHGFRSLPASPEAVAAFLVAESEDGRAASTINRRLAAIQYAHKLARVPDPTEDEAVRATLKGIRRWLGVAPDRKAAITADLLTAMLSHIPQTLTGKRDRALLALGFAGAFRRSELVALDVEDLRDDPEGLRVLVRRSKVDQEGTGFEKAIPHGQFIWPVALVRDWLEAASIAAGPVFTAGNAVGPAPTGGRGIARASPHHAVGRRHREAVCYRGRARRCDGRGALAAGRLHPTGERLQGALRRRVHIVCATQGARPAVISHQYCLTASDLIYLRRCSYEKEDKI